jgi:hypothetical protein
MQAETIPTIDYPKEQSRSERANRLGWKIRDEGIPQIPARRVGWAVRPSTHPASNGQS